MDLLLGTLLGNVPGMLYRSRYEPFWPRVYASEGTRALCGHGPEAPSGRTLHANEEAERLIGHPMLETPRIADFARYRAVHPDGRRYKGEEYPMARVLLTGEPSGEEDMLYSRPDGAVRTFRIKAGPIHDRQGRLRAVVVGWFGPEAAKAGSLLRVESAEDTRGHWDRLRLEQVVTNLLSNAVHHGAGGDIHARVEDLGDQVRLTVRDEGIGISPQDQERIFGRFERAVSGRHYGGLGLGLFITRSLVEALGGSIQVESRLKEGSTFIVTLPRAGPRAERVACAAAPG